MTTIYFIASGREHEITSFFQEREIQRLYSSPVQSAINRIRPTSKKKRLPIHVVDEFEEIELDKVSLTETQERMLDGLQYLLEEESNRIIAVSTHLIPVCTMIHYFDSTFTYDNIGQLQGDTSWIVKVTFDGLVCTSMEEIRCV